MLREARERNAANGLFVVAESLCSMDSDSPDLAGLIAVCRRYDAILILDVAHDLGAVGEDGLGRLGSIPTGSDRPDVVMGSFSKSFAATGGPWPRRSP